MRLIKYIEEAQKFAPQTYPDLGFCSPYTPEAFNVDKYHHGLIGLQTELGEFLGAYKIAVYRDKPLDVVNVFEEIGDIAWYGAELVSSIPRSVWEPHMVEGNLVRYEPYSNELAVIAGIYEIMMNKLCTGPVTDGYRGPFIKDYNFQAGSGRYSIRTIHSSILSKALTVFSCLDSVGKHLGSNNEYLLPKALETNIAKLTLRHGQKFSAETSNNRDVEAERKLLECQSESQP